jgi:RecA-family ATPase
LLYGWRGIGKTHSALSLAVAVASGTSWFGDFAFQTPRPRVVLYLDGEMNRNSLRRRFRNALKASCPPT